MLPLGLLVLQREEVEVGHLQVRLAGFQEAADVPVDAGAWGGVHNVCGERRAVSELLGGRPQRPALQPPWKERRVTKPPRLPRACWRTAARAARGRRLCSVAPPPAGGEVPGGYLIPADGVSPFVMGLRRLGRVAGPHVSTGGTMPRTEQ